jgi:hypothetical protein
MRLFLPTASAGCVNDWLSSTTNTKAHNHTTADPTNLEFLQALRLQHPIKMKLTVIFFALFGQAMVMAMGMATAAVNLFFRLPPSPQMVCRLYKPCAVAGVSANRM